MYEKAAVRIALPLVLQESDTQGSTTRAEATAESALRRLSAEGRWLRLPEPSEQEVRGWLSAMELDLMVAVGGTSMGEDGLDALDALSRHWEAGVATISPVDFYVMRFLTSLANYELTRKRHSNPVVVAFDCDGVLYDFNGTLREWLVSRGWERANLPDPTVYSLSDAWGLHDEHLQEEISLALDAGALWSTGRALMDGVSAAQELGSKGHRIIINTARRIPGREAQSRAATLIWLRSHGIHPDGLHLADPRIPGDKNAVDFDILLDDHAANVRAALSANRSALLIDRQWNAREVGVPRGTFADAVRIVDRQRAPMLSV